MTAAASLAELHAQLARAKNTRLCATMIDDTRRMEREVAEADRTIAAIKARIADADRDGIDQDNDWYFGADRAAAQGIA